MLTTLIVFVVILALAFDFLNGRADSANAIATVVATRVMSPFRAVMMAAAFNLFGALVGTEVADTMSKIINVHAEPIAGPTTLLIVSAGLISAGFWTATMNGFGIPISSSHSLIGGVVGAGIAAGGFKILVLHNINKTLLAMLIAPAMGFLTAYFFYVALIWTTIGWRPTTMNRTFGKLQVVSASWMAFTHGTNDAQKIMGIITMALIAGGFQAPEAEAGRFHVQLWVKLACAGAISLGTAAGGWRVIRTLGHHLTKLGTPEGFAAETSASLVLTMTAWLGVPTSTTHTITSAILGLGATRGMSSIRWGLGEKILLVWVFTLPITAAMGAAIFLVLRLLVPVS